MRRSLPASRPSSRSRRSATESFARWLAHHEAARRGRLERDRRALLDLPWRLQLSRASPASAVRVLEKNGWSRASAQSRPCCGMPNLDGGDVDAAQAKAHVTWRRCSREVDAGTQDRRRLQPTCGTRSEEGVARARSAPPTREGRERHARRDGVPRAAAPRENVVARLREGRSARSRITPRVTSARRRSASPARACSASSPTPRSRSIEQCSAVDGTWGMKAQYYEMGRRYAQKLVARGSSAEAQLGRDRLRRSPRGVSLQRTA